MQSYRKVPRIVARTLVYVYRFYIYNLSIYVSMYISIYIYIYKHLLVGICTYIHKYIYTQYKCEYTYTNICYTNIYLNLYFSLNKFTVSCIHHAPVLLKNLVLPKYIFSHNPGKPIMLGNKNRYNTIV